MLYRVANDFHHAFELIELIFFKETDIFLADAVEDLEIGLETQCAHQDDEGDVFVDVFDFAHDSRFAFVYFDEQLEDCRQGTDSFGQ